MARPRCPPFTRRAPADEIAVSALRAEVQRIEIEAEQAMLFDYAQRITSRSGNDAVTRNVNEYLAMMSSEASDHGAPVLIATAGNQKT